MWRHLPTLQRVENRKPLLNYSVACKLPGTRPSSPRVSFSRVLGGAIRHSYDCSEDANEDDMRHVETGTCSTCDFYKTQNEDLKEQLQSLKQKCDSKYKLS